MSQNPYRPGALEGGPPPPYHVSGPPPPYSQYAASFAYPAGTPPQPGVPNPQGFPSGLPPQPGVPTPQGFPSGPPPFQPGAPPNPSAPPQPGFQPPGGPPYQPGGPAYQPQGGFQTSYNPQPSLGRGAIIRNISTGLVVDGSEYDVKLQPHTGSPYQIWILEPVSGGRFIIKNKGNEAVLDIEGGPDCGAHLITYDKHGGDNQQWFINNPDRTITSAAAELAIDVYEGDCVAGNFLIAYDRHGGPNQQFQVEYQ